MPMTTADGPTEPRSFSGPPHLVRAVAETLAHWLLRGDPVEAVRGWTEREWGAAAWLGYWQNSTPWIVQRAAEDGIDPGSEVRPRLKRAASLMRARTERLFAEGAEVLAALAGAEIPAVPLKGFVISQRCLADPASRPMRDIDLLVAPPDAERAGRVLGSLGYRRLRPGGKTSTWVRGEVRPETWSPDHLRPIDVHTSAERDLAHLGLDIDRLLWDRSAPDTSLGAPALVPDGAALMLHTAVHASRNLLMRNASLSHLRDLDAVGGMLGDAGWNEFLQAADHTARRHAYPAILMLDRYAPGSVPGGVLAALDETAGGRMRAWAREAGIGSASRLEHTERSATPDAVRAMRILANGPREHLRLAFPPRRHVLGPDGWSGRPIWPLAYLWRRTRSVGSLLLTRVQSRR
jgi:hypothetical protein